MQIKAETDCVINELWCKDGDTVQAGAEVIQIELMKMMYAIETPVGGVITYKVKKGDYASKGKVMAEIE